jgi:hypothetical protein
LGLREPQKDCISIPGIKKAKDISNGKLIIKNIKNIS